MGIKIVGKWWFTQMGGPVIGIVEVEYPGGARKCFIGNGDGVDENKDAFRIADTGAAFAWERP